jgi:hypothetical protein
MVTLSHDGQRMKRRLVVYATSESICKSQYCLFIRGIFGKDQHCSMFLFLFGVLRAGNGQWFQRFRVTAPSSRPFIVASVTSLPALPCGFHSLICVNVRNNWGARSEECERATAGAVDRAGKTGDTKFSARVHGGMKSYGCRRRGCLQPHRGMM